MELSTYLPQIMRRAANDPELTKTALALLLAIIDGWVASGLKTPFRSSRRILMTRSHIKSTSTYHKVIRDLQARGHLHYLPSYHPLKASEFALVISTTSER